ncbi:MAG TPA: response regulator transcription factor [Leptolyngbyaceae cyanobacterium M33_DOE_097]|nr:response regulator transcription factor [Leptolyngbyaceae cyanobacterium M33_DOE_097]
MPQTSTQTTTPTILIVDDHEMVLNGTVAVLQQQYPDANLYTARNAQEALVLVESRKPNLVVVDLSMPDGVGDNARTDVGLQLLKTMMERYPNLNIVVQSAHARSLVRLKPVISSHEGGFTVADKSLPMGEMLKKVDWALQGVSFTPREMRNGLEMKPEWMNVLHLAFIEGLQDKTIAERMNVAERTVRHYWTKIQDALDVYPDDGKNTRIQTEMRAREEGLID